MSQPNANDRVAVASDVTPARTRDIPVTDADRFVAGVVTSAPLDEVPRIDAAGGVLWRPGPDGPEVAVVHRARYDDWTLPKGKLKHGEHPLAGAMREVGEEVGVRPVVGHWLASEMYGSPDARKFVGYWAMRPTLWPTKPHADVDAMAWLPAGRAQHRLSYPADAEIVERLGTTPPTSCVLLIRHGSAVTPEQWHGSDSERALNEAGAAQSAALAALLPAFGVNHVAAAPLSRCVETVRPLATRLGLTIRPAPDLDEDRYTAEPEATIDWIYHIARTAGQAAACVQGMVVFEVVQALAQRHAVPLAQVSAAQGSAWALFFAADRLVAADYYAPQG